MDMSIRDLQGGPFVIYFGAWELMLSYLLAIAGSWLVYVIWVNREPGNFWKSISYTAGGRVILGSVLVFYAEATDHFIRATRHFFIVFVKAAQTVPLQEIIAGMALPFLRTTQLALMVADLTCWAGMILWLSAPFNTIWRGNAVLMLIVVPIIIFAFASFALPILATHWGAEG